jgi:hypothetical protein
MFRVVAGSSDSRRLKSPAMFYFLSDSWRPVPVDLQQQSAYVKEREKRALSDKAPSACSAFAK